MRRCNLPIDHRDVMAMPRQRGGNRQPHRPGPHHQHFGPSRKLTHHDPPSPNGQNWVTCCATFFAIGLRQERAVATETTATGTGPLTRCSSGRSPWLRLKEVVVENADRDRNESTHSELRVERDCRNRSRSPCLSATCSAAMLIELEPCINLDAVQCAPVDCGSGDCQHEVVVPSPAPA
jgi:hypothetical protein